MRQTNKRKEDERMTNEQRIIIRLDKIIEDIGVTKLKLAKVSDIRTTTISDLTTNKANVKALKIDTMQRILNALNELQADKVYTIGDLLESEFVE